jgi:hypothetical protein
LQRYSVTSSLRRLCASVYAEHRTLILLLLAYDLAGGVILKIFHRPWPLHIFNSFFAALWVGGSVLWLAWQYLRSPRLLRAALEPHRTAGALLVPLLLVPTQITFQALKQSIAPVIGFPADPVLHRLDVVLHGRMPWQWLGFLLSHEAILRGLDWLYLSWFIGLLLFVLWASWTRHRDLRQRALLTFAFMWIGAGTLAAGAAASAGPCYYGVAVSRDDPYDPYEGLVARLDAFGETRRGPLHARSAQQELWKAQQAGDWEPFGGVSAMPSLHVGIAVLFALIGWRTSRLSGMLLTSFAVAIQVGSVLLAWHYAIDGYAAALLAIASWKLAGRLIAPAAPHATVLGQARIETPAPSIPVHEQRRVVAPRERRQCP